MMAGAEYGQELTPDLSLRIRGDVTGYGAFEYDDLNTARQDAYAVANLRGGVTVGNVLIEGWVRNLFDTKYVPVAFAYDPSSAPSGFLGEPGRPRTAGIRVSVEFWFRIRPRAAGATRCAPTAASAARSFVCRVRRAHVGFEIGQGIRNRST
jgi:hypothetical protein